MRYSFLIIVLFCFLSRVFSQIQPKSRMNESEKGQLQKLETFFCEPIGKETEVDGRHWQTYLDRNLQLDSLESDTLPAGTYSITVLFAIDKEGCITNVRIQNDSGYGLGDKIIRVMSGCNLRWIPAERNGRKVKAFRRQVITFIVEEECEEKIPSEFIL